MTPAAHPLVVAIDGPSGSGKSTVSRLAAERLGFRLLDTGAFYRALTWTLLDRGVDLDDEDAVLAALPGFLAAVQIDTDPRSRRVTVGGRDVTREIRSTAVSSQVSRIARIQGVRDALNARFRAVLDRDAIPGVIAEGRDLTTVVAPHAQARVLLTADERVRVARRVGERADAAASAVAETVTARDRRDLKVVDFAHAAAGVTELDSTDLTLDEAVAALVGIIEAARDRTSGRETNR